MKRSIIVIGLLALGLVLGTRLSARSITPQFEDDGSVKMVAPFPLCGSVTLIPKKDILTDASADTAVQSAFVIYSVFYTDDTNPGKQLGELVLGKQGTSIKFGNGKNLYPKSHYRIYCSVRSYSHTGKPIDRNVDCRDYLKIEHVIRKGACHLPPVLKGTGGTFTPLNMR